MPKPLQSLADYGQSPWIDYVSRPFLRDGEFEQLIRDGIVGVTSNPTIFQGAIADTDVYDDQLREVMQSETRPQERVLGAGPGRHSPSVR